MDKEKLIEIAKFWKQEEYACTACGIVTKVDDIEPKFHPSNQQYSVDCPDCGKHITWLKQAKVLRIFKNIKEGLVEIEKIDRDWLRWALSVDHHALKKAEHRDAAERRIASVDTIDQADWNLSVEDKLRMKQREEVVQLESEIENVLTQRRELVHGTEDYSYAEMRIVEAAGLSMGRRIRKASNRLAKLLGLLAHPSPKATDDKR